MSIRHNYLRDLTANMLSKVCKDIEIEPKLTPLTGEELNSRTANTLNETRLDIRSHRVWERGQQAFLVLRVLDPSACRYLNKLLQKRHVMNEQGKKRAYNERILKIEHGTFTSLVFSIYEVWGGKVVPFIQDDPIYFFIYIVIMVLHRHTLN